MCTVILLHRNSPECPLLVAANRDENPERPTKMPGPIGDGVFAPQDLVFGGSWIGVNSYGLLVAVTNRHLGSTHMRGRRSRGHLVTDILRSADSTEDAVRQLFAEPIADELNAYHLVLADRKQVAVIWSDGGPFTVQWTEPGLQVITGLGFTPGHSIRDAIIRTRLRELGPMPSLSDLQTLLGLHGPGPEDGTCVHGPDVTHESIFSSVIRLNTAPNAKPNWDIHWRAGRPCTAPVWHFNQVWAGATRERRD